MRRNSRYQWMFIASVVVFALMAFAPISAQGTTITFLTPPWGVPPDEAALTAFQEETGITVEIQSVQSADLFSRVQVAAASGQPAADVIFLTEEAPSNIVATGNMMSLNDLIAATTDLDLADFEKVDFWTMDDQVYGIPTYLQLVMMDYNAATLAEAGFDAPPTTWDELTAQAQAIKEQGIDDYPIAFGANDWSWYLMALSMGDPMFDEELNPVFADEGSQARRAMNLLLSYFSEELISPEILAGSITQHPLFWSGTGVFHQGWQARWSSATTPKPRSRRQMLNTCCCPKKATPGASPPLSVLALVPPTLMLPGSSFSGTWVKKINAPSSTPLVCILRVLQFLLP
ncbi:MAG: putative ABC transporter substrate binding protein [Chloroflexi bacterium OLB15]|nr:MAG: putative ABC transporter substrate binding protein [Chloroflexi bacterium OLB15]